MYFTLVGSFIGENLIIILQQIVILIINQRWLMIEFLKDPDPD